MKSTQASRYERNINRDSDRDRIVKRKNQWKVPMLLILRSIDLEEIQNNPQCSVRYPPTYPRASIGFDHF